MSLSPLSSSSASPSSSSSKASSTSFWAPPNVLVTSLIDFNDLLWTSIAAFSSATTGCTTDELDEVASDIEEPPFVQELVIAFEAVVEDEADDERSSISLGALDSLSILGTSTRYNFLGLALLRAVSLSISSALRFSSNVRTNATSSSMSFSESSGAVCLVSKGIAFDFSVITFITCSKIDPSGGLNDEELEVGKRKAVRIVDRSPKKTLLR